MRKDVLRKTVTEKNEMRYEWKVYLDEGLLNVKRRKEPCCFSKSKFRMRVSYFDEADLNIAREKVFEALREFKAEAARLGAVATEYLRLGWCALYEWLTTKYRVRLVPIDYRVTLLVSSCEVRTCKNVGKSRDKIPLSMFIEVYGIVTKVFVDCVVETTDMETRQNNVVSENIFASRQL